MTQRPGARIVAECPLDQALVAGVGDIRKSEILFAARIDTRPAASSLTLRKRASLARLVPEVYRAKVNGGRMKLAAYRRTGKLCPGCGCAVTFFAVARGGTYACPSCQPADVPGRMV